MPAEEPVKLKVLIEQAVDGTPAAIAPGATTATLAEEVHELAPVTVNV